MDKHFVKYTFAWQLQFNLNNKEVEREIFGMNLRKI